MASLRWRAPPSRRFGRLSASCRACVETAAGSVARASVRPTVHDPIRRFPPPGPRGAGSPTSAVLSADSDFSPPVPPRFVFLRLAVPPSALFAPARSGRASGPGLTRLSRPPVHPRRLAGGDDETSQVPGRPLPACPALRPRRNRRRPASLGAAMVPSALVTASASTRRTISGLNHAACKASCVRFAAGVAPGPRNTRFRLVGQPWPVRSFTCRVAIEGFRHVIACTSPFAKLRLAQDKSVPYGTRRRGGKTRRAGSSPPVPGIAGATETGRDKPVPYGMRRRGGRPVGRGSSPPVPGIAGATETGRDKPVPYGMRRRGA